VDRRQLRRFTSQPAALFVTNPVLDNCQCQLDLQFMQQPVHDLGDTGLFLG
jgi:hypothetical protein